MAAGNDPLCSQSQSGFCGAAPFCRPPLKAGSARGGSRSRFCVERQIFAQNAAPRRGAHRPSLMAPSRAPELTAGSWGGVPWVRGGAEGKRPPVRTFPGVCRPMPGSLSDFDSEPQGCSLRWFFSEPQPDRVFGSDRTRCEWGSWTFSVAGHVVRIARFAQEPAPPSRANCFL